MALRQIIRTIAGSAFGLDKNGNGVWNRTDGSQIVLEADLTTGQPKVRTTTSPSVGAVTTDYYLSNLGNFTSLPTLQAALAAAGPGSQGAVGGTIYDWDGSGAMPRGLSVPTTAPTTRPVLPKTALAAIQLAASRRVDLVMLGDSNQFYGGYGFASGIDNYLSGIYGSYATCINAVTSQFTQSGGQTSNVDVTSMTLNSGADATLSPLWSAGPDTYTLTGYGHYSGAGANGVGGTAITGANTLGSQNALTAWFAYGQAVGYTGGSFTVGARLGVSPYSTIATGTNQSTTGDFSHYQISSLSIPADATRAGKNIEARFAVPGGTNAVGPLDFFWSRIENPAKTAGISCSTLYQGPSQSLWNFNYGVRNIPDEALKNFFAETRRLQQSVGQYPIVVVYINSGVNDRAEGNSPAWGPAASVAPTSAAAYVDNIRGLQDRIYAVWQKAGWDVASLYWLICPSHRIADPDDAQLVSYRAAAVSAFGSDYHATVVDLGAKMTYAAANAAGWYAAGQNQIHLTQAGYDGVAPLIFSGP